MNESRKPLHPLHGIIVFVLIMITFLLLFAPLQYYFGMGGVALTELGLLLLTLLAVVLTRQKFREVFPISRPHFGQIMGTLMIWAGCLLSVMLVTLILMLFFPEGFLEVSTSLNSTFSSTPPLLTFLIVAVMPAICEEAMHRGFILHTFRSVQKDWLVVICMGIIFGLFHMDPYRFLPTALLGMGLTYVMRKSDNLLLPALFHFVNNAFSSISSFTSSSSILESEETAALLNDPSYIKLCIGTYLILGFFAPILLYGGSHLLKKASGCLEKRSDTRITLTVVAVILVSVLMLAAGLIILVSNMGNLLKMGHYL